MTSAQGVVHDVTDPNSWGPALDEAVNTLRRGGLVVLPTDTVYGVAAEAFDPAAVAAIAAAKGRAGAAGGAGAEAHTGGAGGAEAGGGGGAEGRAGTGGSAGEARTPVPVLIPDARTLDGLAAQVSDDARALVAAFWPGALTVVLEAQPSLAWDLGDSAGTVALRMPDHPAALALLKRTGPLAVTGAQRAGGSPPLDVNAAREQLGDAVVLYLDGGTLAGGASTVVDATTTPPRLAREGLVPLERLRAVVPDLVAPADAGPPAAGATAVVPEAAGSSAAGRRAAEPTVAGPSAAEPTAAEPSAAEPTAAEPSAAEPTAAGRAVVVPGAPDGPTEGAA